MRLMTLVMCVGLTFVLQTSPTWADNADCRPTLISSLPMTAEPDGRYSIPVAINGAQHRMLVASSTPYSVLLKEFVRAAGLRERSFDVRKTFYALGGKSPGYAMVDSLSIANNGGTEIKTLIAPGSYPPDPDVVGAIGMDLLANFDVEVDFKSRQLNLFTANLCEGTQVYWTKQYSVLAAGSETEWAVPMTLDGKPVEVAFDTLSPTSVMRLDVANELFGLDEHSAGIESVRHDENRGPIFRYRFGTLTADGIAINKPTIVLTGEPDALPCDGKARKKFGAIPGQIVRETCRTNGDLKLGMRELRAFHLYFAYKARKLYFTAADAD